MASVEGTVAAVIPLAKEHGIFSVALVIFVIFGVKHIPAIISACGKIYIERYKAKLSHKRAMEKIGNQLEKNK